MDAAETLASLLAPALAGGPPLASVPQSALVADQAAAYRAQALVAAALGPVAGWKVGRKAPGASPAIAPLFAKRRHRSGETLARDAFRLWRVEAELAYRMARDLPAAGRPYARDTVLAAVAELVAVFEIVDSRYAAWPEMSPAMLLADLQSHGAMVIGEAVPWPASADPLGLPVRLEIGGETVRDQAGGNPAGDIAELLVWAANRDGPALRAGDLVTTGSYTGVEEVPPGGRALATFGGVGTVSISRGS